MRAAGAACPRPGGSLSVGFVTKRKSACEAQGIRGALSVPAPPRSAAGFGDLRRGVVLRRLRGLRRTHGLRRGMGLRRSRRLRRSHGSQCGGAAASLLTVASSWVAAGPWVEASLRVSHGRWRGGRWVYGIIRDGLPWTNSAHARWISANFRRSWPILA